MTKLDVTAIRQELRASYIDYPDDSHGEGYRNSGIVSALVILARMAGDIDREAPCEDESDYRSTGNKNWCRTHFAPKGSSLWCDLAEKPWVWRDAALAARRSR